MDTRNDEREKIKADSIHDKTKKKHRQNT
jgi:hypothetical protein